MKNIFEDAAAVFFLKKIEQMHNEFSVKLSNCIGSTGGADAAIKVATMEGYCKVLKEDRDFDTELYQLLINIAKPEATSGSPEEVVAIQKQVLGRYTRQTPEEKYHQKKEIILNSLLATLRYTDAQINDLVLIDDETVEIRYQSGGTYKVNIAADSGTAMIRDIMKYI